MSLKSLARAVLERNRQGNHRETEGKNHGNFGGQKRGESFHAVSESLPERVPLYQAVQKVLDSLIRDLSLECPQRFTVAWLKAHDPEYYLHLKGRAKAFENARLECIEGRVPMEPLENAAKLLSNANRVAFELYETSKLLESWGSPLC